MWWRWPRSVEVASTGSTNSCVPLQANGAGARSRPSSAHAVGLGWAHNRAAVAATVVTVATVATAARKYALVNTAAAALVGGVGAAAAVAAAVAGRSSGHMYTRLLSRCTDSAISDEAATSS